MTTRWMLPAALGAAALIWTVVPATSQSGQSGRAKAGEWPTYGGDLANTHYSPLDQITAENFNRLQVAWRFKTDNYSRNSRHTALHRVRLEPGCRDGLTAIAAYQARG